MEADVEMICGILHTITGPNHRELRLLIGKSKDACEKCYTDWLDGIKALSEEYVPIFFSFLCFGQCLRGTY
jgi:hypothetical protein